MKGCEGVNSSLDTHLGPGRLTTMPRKPRVEYPGAIYHVMSRANGKGVIFETEVDRQPGTSLPKQSAQREIQ